MIQPIYNATHTDYVWPVVRFWQWCGEFSYLRRELGLIQESCIRHNITALLQKSSVMVFAPRGNKFASFEDFYKHLGGLFCVTSGNDLTHTLTHDGIEF